MSNDIMITIMYLQVEERLSHKLWRKLIKKKRRKSKRQNAAQEKKEIHKEELRLLLLDPNYVEQLKEEEEYAIECQLLDEELAQKKIKEWELRDIALHKQWLANQEKRKRIEENLRLQEEKIRKEFEENLLKENKKKDADAKAALLQEATSQLGSETDVSHNPEPPLGYVRPEREPCPFFLKTGACRFGFNCSREHDYPVTSRTILLPNMYANFGLEGASRDDYDTDISLEFTESDRYKDYRDFFEDALPEFEKIGRVIQFKTCNNKSPHLRGNVYVQFEKNQEAEVAASFFNGRWYAGRQISCRFVPVERWKKAICGLYWSQKCPKGDQCNYLHVFRNPGNAFYDADHDRFPTRSQSANKRSSPGSSSSRRSRRRSRSRSRNRDSSRSEDSRENRRNKFRTNSTSISRRTSTEERIKRRRSSRSSSRDRKKRKLSPTKIKSRRSCSPVGKSRRNYSPVRESRKKLHKKSRRSFTPEENSN